MQLGLGEAFALLSALTWAGGVILYKRLGETLPPLVLNLVKNLLVLVLVLPTVWLLQPQGWMELQARHLVIAIASGFIGIALADSLYFKALNTLGAGRVGIVGNLYSPFVVLLSFLFLGERLLPVQLAGFALVLLGVGVIGGLSWPLRFAGTRVAPGSSASQLAGERSRLRKGLLLAALAIFLMAVAIVMVKRTLETQPFFWIVLLRLLGAVGGMALSLPWLMRSGQLAALASPALSWPLLVAAALLGQYLAMMLWLAAYGLTTASVASVLNETASVFIVLLAWVFLGERPDRRKLTGVALTLLGVWLMLLPGLNLR